MARDTVFATVMIVLNGVVGLCLVFGGMRYGKQVFQEEAAAAALSVLGTLAVLTLVLPDYTIAVPGPAYSTGQLVFVGLVSLGLYGLFLFVQTVRHRADFLDLGGEGGHGARPSGRAALASAGLLVLGLAAVILLAEDLSPALARGVDALGLPAACVGVAIAAVVLLPEGLSAFRAARANRLQSALNYALGSALASIGLTIPLVAAVSLVVDAPLVLGLDPEHVVLLLLSLFVSTITLGAGRTTVLQGAVHLAIFGTFLTISAIP